MFVDYAPCDIHENQSDGAVGQPKKKAKKKTNCKAEPVESESDPSKQGCLTPIGFLDLDLGLCQCHYIHVAHQTTN